MGSRSVLLPISLVISGLNGLISLLPFIFVWLIIRTLLTDASASYTSIVYTYAWWAVACAVMGVVLYFIALSLSHLTAFRVEINMRKKAMEHITRMPLGYFSQRLSGKLRKVIDEDTSQTHTFIAHLLPDIVGSVMAPVGVLILIFLFDWRLGVTCMLPIILAMTAMSSMLNPKRNKFQREYLDAQEKMSSEAVEYVRGIPVVKVFQQTVFSFKRFYDSIIEYRNLVSMHTLNWRNPMAFYTVFINGFAFFLVPAALLLINNLGDPYGIIADLFLYLLIAPVLSSNVMKLAYLSQNLFLLKEALGRVEVLTAEASLVEPEHPQSPVTHDITFEHVTFRYPDAQQDAVCDISFTIPEGKTYALVGASGGGKSSIARLIPRFWDVTSGRVRIGGVDVRQIKKEDLMTRVAFVFQNTKLFKMSLRGNLTYGNPNASEEDIKHALELSQSHTIVDNLPNKLETIIGSEGTYLSGGEQQRIALARALLKDAPIVILDEATAFSDPENEHLIQQALKELMRQKTTLMIAHRLDSVQHVDQILVIDAGKIVEQGTHNELLQRKGIYSNMWEEYQRSVTWTL